MILILKMKENNIFQHMLLYFKKYKNSTQTTIKILYSLKDTVNEQVCKKSGMQIFMVEVAC